MSYEYVRGHSGDSRGVKYHAFAISRYFFVHTLIFFFLNPFLLLLLHKFAANRSTARFRPCFFFFTNIFILWESDNSYSSLNISTTDLTILQIGTTNKPCSMYRKLSGFFFT